MIGKSEIDLKIIFNLIGLLLFVEGFFMLLGLPFSLYYDEEQVYSLLFSFLITSGSGGLLWFITRKKNKDTINKREGFLLLSFTWVAFTIFGMLPFLISGAIPSVTDAFFESMSGFTTTGASILTDVEILPQGILFWRSMTQWIGGMGIIILSVAVLPFLGIGGVQLYTTEIPGVSKDKLHPQINDMARKLLAVYVLLTLALAGLLMLGGMKLPDSLCHAFGTLSTGGFSTKNANIGVYSAYIQYTIIIFMILAGTNFTLHYLALQGKFKKLWHSEEYRKYLYIIAFFSLVIALFLVVRTGMDGEKALRDALFQVVSIVTTTGYSTSNYMVWPGGLWAFILLLMFVGGMAGSTGGGVKVIRQLLLFKNAGKELKRALHPQGIIPVRLNNEAVSQDIIYKVMAFCQLYILVFIFGAMILSFLGLDFETAMGASISALGNIGPGLGNVGPAGNYAYFPSAGKWFLSFLMLLGRLELFTVMILITRSFWKR
jgi:trk system potassium uptake protein TrkH